MSDQTFRILVLKGKGNKQTRCFRERSIELMHKQIAKLTVKPEKETKEAETLRNKQHERLQEQMTLLLEKGEWREVWLKQPQAIHDEEITAACLVKDPETGRRYDPSLENAARCAVMVEKWNGFKQAPSIEAFRELEMDVARAVSEEIYEWLFPSGLDESFFAMLSGS